MLFTLCVSLFLSHTQTKTHSQPPFPVFHFSAIQISTPASLLIFTYGPPHTLPAEFTTSGVREEGEGGGEEVQVLDRATGRSRLKPTFMLRMTMAATKCTCSK